MPKISTHRQQRGATLVEVLVTAVIISVGLLGVAALHLTSLRGSTDSNNRSKATWYANDIMERMRANKTAADSGGYLIAYGANVAPGTIAQNDLNQWKTELAAAGGLPNGDGEISRTTVVGTTVKYEIKIRWSERDSSTAIEFITQAEI